MLNKTVKFLKTNCAVLLLIFTLWRILFDLLIKINPFLLIVVKWFPSMLNLFSLTCLFRGVWLFGKKATWNSLIFIAIDDIVQLVFVWGKPFFSFINLSILTQMVYPLENHYHLFYMIFNMHFVEEKVFSLYEFFFWFRYVDHTFILITSVLDLSNFHSFVIQWLFIECSFYNMVILL